MPSQKEALYRRAFVVMAMLLCLSEAGVRWKAPALWQDPLRIETPSAALLRDRVSALAPGPLVFLGDSVVYGSALREHGDADWRTHTPAAALRRRLAERGLAVQSFAADGLFPQDLEALYAAVRGLSPSAVVLELNARMLCAEAGVTATALARPYLAAWLPKEAMAASPGWEDRAAGALRSGWATWRYMEWLSSRVLQPSLKERLQPLAARLCANGAGIPSADDQDAKDALLDMKLRPYYQAPAPSAAHAGWASLERLARVLRQDGIPCVVFLTPQNLARVENLLDADSFKANRAALAKTFGPQKGRLRYADWAQRKPNGAFLDHCHLDARGNEGLAAWIVGELDAAR